MESITVITTYSNGEKVITEFDRPLKAIRFMREEVKWENTHRVECPFLNLTMQGDFASYHTVTTN